VYTISKDFLFSASHHLHGLPPEHPCGRLHGHNYTVRVQLSGPLLDKVGMLFDYGGLAPFGAWLDEHLDHRDLNEQLAANPTAEQLAYRLAQVVTEVCELPDEVALAVGVSETAKTWAWFIP